MSCETMEESEPFIHTSSQRCRDLLEKGFAPAKLSDYAHGSITTLLNMLNTLYASLITFHPFEESDGDAGRVYYTDAKTGEDRGVATVFLKYSEKAKSSSPPWNIHRIDFTKTADAKAKINIDFLQGKSKTYFGTLMINPFLPRNGKLRETENIIRQLREQIEWETEADKFVVTGEYKMNGGWQWFIAAEYFKKYIQVIEDLFFQKKITDLSGNVPKVYGESEASQMVADIAAREKSESKRKMVAYLNSKTEFTQEQLDQLQLKALAATVTAQENVYNYEGHKEFKKPKKNNKPPTANVTCKKQTGKSNDYWRITIWVLLSSKEMAAAPSTILCWQLLEHPSVSLSTFGNNGKPAKTFAKKQKAAWETYSSRSTSQAGKRSTMQAGKSNTSKAGKHKKRTDFGAAGDSGSSSSASASAGSKFKHSKDKHPLGHLAESAQDLTTRSDDVMERLQMIEKSMKVAATKQDLVRAEKGFAKVASLEVTKRFAAFQQIMQAFALEMSAIKEDLAMTQEHATKLITELTAEVTPAEKDAIRASFAGMGFSAENLEQVVQQSIKNNAAKQLATAKQVTKIGDKIQANSARLFQVAQKVESTVAKLAAKAGVEYSSPKVLKKKRALPESNGQLDLEADSEDSDDTINNLFVKRTKTSAQVTPVASINNPKKKKKKKQQQSQ